MDCLFCKILKGDIPAAKLYEDEHAVAFNDINPQAPVHVLIIPKKHIPTVNDIKPDDEGIVGHLFTVAAKIASDKGIATSGYRSVFNCNSDAGQMVFHLHLHLIGGRKLSWPPG
jgi:histidine triad (HIT) family protein